MVAIDPRNTSRTCHSCGIIDKTSRKSQAAFSCTSCGYTASADYVAARNIRAAGVACNPTLSSRLATRDAGKTPAFKVGDGYSSISY